MTDALDPKLIPHHKKKKLLASYSEDDFRELVVRPLFIQKGFVHGHDTCGPNELGKDCYFWTKDSFENKRLAVVQTKRGDLKMSRKAESNIVECITQLKTALNTSVSDISTHQKHYPYEAFLIASGEINANGRDHITSNVSDNRLFFMDSETLIPLIDQLMPEFWNEIDLAKIPYLKHLRDNLIEVSKAIDISEIGVSHNAPAPITADTFAPLYFSRITQKPGDRDGHFSVEEIKANSLLDRPEPHILITGGAGSGKTTTLRRLAMILIETALQRPQTSTPVFITATEIATHNGTLQSLAENTARKFTPTSSAAFTLNDLESGRVTILIDGFDEVANPSTREEILLSISVFKRQYPKCKIFLASRDNPQILSELESQCFQRFKISPISLTQAQKLISLLTSGKSLRTEDQQEMLRRLNNVHGIELNPLLVTVFVATSEFNRTDIPANITELFKKYTEMMIGRWNRSKGVSEQIHAPVKDFVLCQLAYTMHSQRVTHLPTSDAEILFNRELSDRGLESDSQTLLVEAIYQSGLFRVEDGKLSFRHHLLQEFFAGRGIPSTECFSAIASDSWWSRAIVFYCGNNPSSMDAMRALLETPLKSESSEKFQLAITTGLACQACYLLKKEDRTETLAWVVMCLADANKTLADELQNENKGVAAIIALSLYVSARDAVAAKGILEVHEKIISNGPSNDEESFSGELVWTFAGLIESRQLTYARDGLKSYKPSNSLHLLLLLFGAQYVANMHVTDSSEKSIAKDIAKDLEPKVETLRLQIASTLKTMLLEMRKGQVKRLIASPPNADANHDILHTELPLDINNESNLEENC